MENETNVASEEVATPEVPAETTPEVAPEAEVAAPEGENTPAE